MTFTAIVILSILGMITGLFAGLFGIGGGAILVPALTTYFLWQQFDPHVVVHMALATSMSCIVFNALLSIHTHQKHQAIIWNITFWISPSVLIGSAIATLFVLQVTANTVAFIFFILMFLIALQMLFDLSFGASTSKPVNKPELAIVGFFIGLVSSMIAIGGGSLTVPYLKWHQIGMRRAIATASSIGLPIAVASTLIFIFQEPKQINVPADTLGYVYWPATLSITLGSMLTTRIGANLTHKLPIVVLTKMFAVLIILMAFKMYLSFNQ